MDTNKQVDLRTGISTPWHKYNIPAGDNINLHISLDPVLINHISKHIYSRYTDISRNVVVENGIVRVGNIKLGTVRNNQLNFLIHVPAASTLKQINDILIKFAGKATLELDGFFVSINYNKVLLVGPHSGENSIERPTLPPKGIYRIQYVALTQSKDTDVLIFDPNFHQDLNAIIAHNFDIVGFSSLIHTLPNDIKIIESVLNRNETITSLRIIGGMATTYLDINEVFKLPVDLAVKGSGEEPFMQILAKLPVFKTSKDTAVFNNLPGVSLKSDKSTYNVIPNLYNNELFKKVIVGDFRLVPLSDNQDITSITGYWNNCLRKRKGAIPLNEIGSYPLYLVVSHRVCKGKCVFCSSMSTLAHRFGNKLKHVVVSLSAGEISRLIQTAKKEHPEIDSIHFSEDDLVGHRGFILSICKQLKQNAKLASKLKARVDEIDVFIIQTLYDAGFRSIAYGIESFSQRILDSLNKQTTVEQNINAINIAIEKGFIVGMNLILFTPESLEEDILKTMDTAIEFINKYPSRAYCVFTPYMNALPGSRLLLDPKINHNYKHLIEWNEISLGKYSNIVLPGKVNVKDFKMQNLLNTALDKFDKEKESYLINPKYLLNYIPINISPIIFFTIVYFELGKIEQALRCDDLVFRIAAMVFAARKV